MPNGKMKPILKLDGMTPSERETMLMAMAGLIILIIAGGFFGAIWFKTHPGDLNQPIVPESYWIPILVVLGGAGLLLALNLMTSKKNVAWKVAGMVAAWGLGIVLYVWWYHFLPYVFGA